MGKENVTFLGLHTVVKSFRAELGVRDWAKNTFAALINGQKKGGKGAAPTSTIEKEIKPLWVRKFILMKSFLRKLAWNLPT